MPKTKVLYNVYCVDCDSVFQPALESPLWWQAKQRTEKGYLDALQVSGYKCGCVKKPASPEAPFRVFGYNSYEEDYDIPCESFVAAVKTYLRMEKEGDVVFISGVSHSVQNALERAEEFDPCDMLAEL